MLTSINIIEDFLIEKKEKTFSIEHAGSMESFWSVLKEEVLEQIIVQFGIERWINTHINGGVDSYKIGGDVSTVHNASNNIFVDNEHELRYKKEFNRKNYEGRVEKDKQGRVVHDNRLSTQRKQKFQENDIIVDGYTGKRLNKNSSAHIDHIVSAKEIHNNDKARLYLTDDERNDMSVSKNNTTFTDSSLNQSKGEKDLSKFMNTEKVIDKDGNKINNAKRYDMHKKNSLKKDCKARKSINKTVRKGQISELSKASYDQGIKQVEKQAIGLIMYELADLFISEMQLLVKEWSHYKTFDSKIEAFKSKMYSIKSSLIEKIKKIKSSIFLSVSEGFIGGVINTLITTLINTFITTSRNLGKFLKDGIGSVIKGFKLLVTNPDKLDKKRLIKEVIKVIGIGASISFGLIITESIRNNMIGYPSVVIDVITNIVGALVTGSLSSIVIYLVDNIGVVFISFSSMLDNNQLKQSYRNALNEVDNEYQNLLEKIYIEYAELNKLGNLALDMSAVASIQFESSIEYARYIGVPDDDILKTISDIDEYFIM